MLFTLVRACALSLAVQTAPQASVDGIVGDAGTGQPLSGAAVLLTDLDRRVITGADGRYAFPEVPPGPQHLTVRQLGYRTRTLHLLVPRAGRLEFNVSLRPSPIQLEAIVVAPTRPVRGLDPGDSTAFPERGITHAALQNHPTLTQADPLRALAGGEVVLEPEAPTGVHVRGGAADHTGYLLDGVPVLNPYHAAGLFSAWNPDALARLHLAGAAPSPALPDALSGAIVARTRDPGHRLRMQSTLSTTEARMTLDGPAGVAGAAYLLSWRTGLTGALAPGDEASYLTGETADIVGKIQVPVLGGGLRLLIYDAENELGAASTVPAEDAPSRAPRRNAFAWGSRSVGVSWEWSRGRGGGIGRGDASSCAAGYATTVTLGAWRAGADAAASWNATSAADVHAVRRDHGLHTAIERRSRTAANTIGLRFRSTETGYRVRANESPTAWDASGRTVVLTAYAEHSRRLSASVEAWGGAAASAAGGELYVAPRAQLGWRTGDRLAWTAAYSRTHQFAQSLRNPESVVGHVFPADLFLGAGVAGVPVPESDQLVMAGEWTPFPGVRLGAQAFARRMEDLLLVAPRAQGPFASATFAVGGADAHGASVELAGSGARYGIVGSYGWQRVRLAYGDSAYAPRHGTAHTVDAGVILFPTPTAALRAAISAAFGRTATAQSGPFEWEACNVLDQGCEFAGSPGLAGPLGGTPLPAYVRLDLGGKKHWHVSLRGRDVLVGVFGTLTNVLGRRNTLIRVIDPDTGESRAVGMLPPTPLVLGIDTRF